MMQKILTRKHYVQIQRHLLAFGYFEFIDFLYRKQGKGFRKKTPLEEKQFQVFRKTQKWKPLQNFGTLIIEKGTHSRKPIKIMSSSVKNLEF